MTLTYRGQQYTQTTPTVSTNKNIVLVYRGLKVKK
ncbi:MAG: DUF4278 domain-containing protein [Synechococcus sp.]